MYNNTIIPAYTYIIYLRLANSTLLGVLKSEEFLLTSIWTYFSNYRLFLEKIWVKFCLIFVIFFWFPNTVHAVLIFPVSRSWIINSFEKYSSWFIYLEHALTFVCFTARHKITWSSPATMLYWTQKHYLVSFCFYWINRIVKSFLKTFESRGNL